MNRQWIWGCLACCALFVGCGDEGGTDAGVDAGRDSERADALDGGGLLDAEADVALDTGPDLSCMEEGAMRVAACGMCGTRSEACTSGEWTPQSMCLGEGECAVGAVETETTAMCGMRQRLCMDGCAWGAWSAIREDGECAPGEERPGSGDRCDVSEIATDECSDACAWEERACEDPCGTYDTTGLDAEVCIPEGDVMLNATDEDSPVFPVLVSTFLIGKYPVTLGRYNECVAAGACVEPLMFEMSDDEAVATARAGAVAFCEWDSGGRLPTIAEWMKAARGPAPRSPRFPWWNGLSGVASNDHLGCDTYPGWDDIDTCPDRFGLDRPVNVVPWTASIYGVERLIDLSTRFVSDVYVADLRPLYDRTTSGDPSLRDPTGPELDAGSSFTSIGGEALGDRQQVDVTHFRCVREVSL